MVLLLVVSAAGKAQTTPAQALDNVMIHMADGNTIESGTIVWRNGIIEAVGSDVTIPFDAYVIDGGDSLHVYPGFIDGLALWGSPDLPENYRRPDRPGEPGYDRAGIQPQRQPNKLLKSDDKNLTEAQKLGFTTAALGLKGHMLPGQIDLFFLNGEQTGEHLIKKGIGLSGSFNSAPGRAYPSTLMGVMARFRQLWYDATALKVQTRYYAAADDNYPVPRKDEVLEALFPVVDQLQPMFFEVDTRENITRLLWLKDELGFDVVLVSAEEAFPLAEELSERNIPVLVSIDLPAEPEWRVKDDEDEEKKPEEVTEEMRIFRERQLQAYQARIENIKKLMDAGVKVGFASNGLKPADFRKHLKVLHEEGDLSEQQILALLTQQTADILGVGTKMGDLKQGKVASFTAFTKPLLDDKAKALYSVSGGNLTEFEIEASNGK
jgi:hypothetical protein